MPDGFVTVLPSKWAGGAVVDPASNCLTSSPLAPRRHVGPVGPSSCPSCPSLSPRLNELYCTPPPPPHPDSHPPPHPASLSGMSGICSRSSSWQVGQCPSVRPPTPCATCPTFGSFFFFFFIVSGARRSHLHSQTLIRPGAAERPVCGRWADNDSHKRAADSLQRGMSGGEGGDGTA